MLSRSTIVLAKLEVTYGTDPTPAAANAILVSNPDVRTEGEMHVRDYVRTSLSPIGHVVGKKKVTVTFETELKGSGYAGTAPETGVLFQCCGLKETVSASTSVTYEPEPTAANVKSCTMYIYFEDMLHEVNGCRGTFSMNMEAGNFGKISWTFTGKYVAPVDGTAPASPEFDDTSPPLCTSTSFAWDSYAPATNALTFDIANTIGAPGDLNSSDGYGEYQITARDSQGSIDPVTETMATQQAAMTADFWADWSGYTGRALTITIGAGGDGNTCDIDMPNVIPREITFGDREGVRTYQIPFTAAGTAGGSGDDEISIVFT